MIALLLSLTAAATESRQTLEDALLARALGDHEVSRSRLLTLTRTLASDDPVRGWALYWLATQRLDWGDTEGARESLRDCIRTGPARDLCEDLLGRVELEARAIRTVPTVWSFDGPHGVILPGTGRMAVENEALFWTHARTPNQPGTLLFGVDLPGDARVAEVTATLTSLDRDAWVGFVFVDVEGRVFPAVEGVQRLRAGAPTVIRANLRDGPDGLVGNAIERILLRDMSALNDNSGDPSELVIDDLGLR